MHNGLLILLVLLACYSVLCSSVWHYPFEQGDGQESYSPLIKPAERPMFA